MQFGTANNCTIISNTAYSNGGGLRLSIANNCIVWYNVAGADSNSFLGTLNYSCSPEATHGSDGNITNAPAFMDQLGGNYRLAFNSPCIETGTNGFVVGTSDLDGANRIVEAIVDMGAYEYDAVMADSDGDGMTDYWEALYFSSATGAVTSANADMDSSNNGDEFIAGTDPTNSASFFAITNAAAIPEGFVVQWDGVAGRVYTVNWTDTLTNNFQVLETEIAYPQNSYTDTLHTAEATAFYDMEVKLSE